jgi:hypothetical protein
MAAIPLRHEVFYPESDGQPMAETGMHVTELAKLLGLLKHHFRHQTDVYASANMFLYYAEGDPRSCVAPDLYVAKGGHRQPRAPDLPGVAGGSAAVLRARGHLRLDAAH